MRVLVLDASAVVKWFVREEEFKEMKRVRSLFLRREVEIYVPNLLFTELSNALRYTEGLNAEDVIKAINALQNLGLKIVNSLQLLKNAIEIAFEKDLTVYDSIYLALARRIGGVLITYDKELLSKCGETAMKASTYLKTFHI